jgi:hypothetical protein
MTDAIAHLRQAIELVRAQIPRGELTVASVRRLLDSAEAVCREEEASQRAPAAPRAPSRQSIRRIEERRKWARIARETERELRDSRPAAE